MKLEFPNFYEEFSCLRLKLNDSVPLVSNPSLLL